VITIGIDPHKGTHTAAAVEGATGQFLDELTVPATDEGAERLHAWAHQLADLRRPIGSDRLVRSVWKALQESPSLAMDGTIS
jgi:hypothetical protein